MSAAEDFAALLRDDFGVEELPTGEPALIALEDHHRLAEALKERGYTLYGFVVASDWPADPKGADELAQAGYFEVATGLRRPTTESHLASWRVRVPREGELQSLVDLFVGADWQEREQFDLVGVCFANHPDPRRLMLPEDWEGHPLMRDYAIDTPHPPWR